MTEITDDTFVFELKVVVKPFLFYRTIEPRLGRLSFFTSGIENKHHVKRVTSGVRYALTMGFTCDPSKAIPEPGSEEHYKLVMK